MSNTVSGPLKTVVVAPTLTYFTAGLVTTSVMPELAISEELYQQIEAETDDGDIEETLWKMIGMYRRARNPEAETE